MCLVTLKEPKFRRTLFWHTYYKILCYEKSKDWYWTPYVHDPTVLGVTKKIDKETPWDIDHYWLSDTDKKSNYYNAKEMWHINGGCFHLFRRKKNAVWDANVLQNDEKNEDLEYIVVKAIVPPGTQYIKGLYGFDKAIVVRTVKYQKL